MDSVLWQLDALDRDEPGRAESTYFRRLLEPLSTLAARVQWATKTSQYRDTIELMGPDHKVMTSSIQNEDGTWTSYMTREYRRKLK